jgi:hypothetical protein
MRLIVLVVLVVKDIQEVQGMYLVMKEPTKMILT